MAWPSLGFLNHSTHITQLDTEDVWSTGGTNVQLVQCLLATMDPAFSSLNLPIPASNIFSCRPLTRIQMKQQSNDKSTSSDTDAVCPETSSSTFSKSPSAPNCQWTLVHWGVSPGCPTVDFVSQFTEGNKNRSHIQFHSNNMLRTL